MKCSYIEANDRWEGKGGGQREERREARGKMGKDQVGRREGGDRGGESPMGGVRRRNGGGISGMGGNEVQRKMGGEGSELVGSEKSVWALHRVKMTRGGGVGGRERGQVISQSDILGTRTHGYGSLH